MATPWEDLEEREERLAGEEASRIGGPAPQSDADPAQRPIQEAGGGESEGWEETEAELIRHASHADDRSSTVILEEAARPEQEADLSTAQYAEADQTPGGS